MFPPSELRPNDRTAAEPRTNPLHSNDDLLSPGPLLHLGGAFKTPSPLSWFLPRLGQRAFDQCKRKKTNRKFPGLISGPTIDWFLPWPEEALVAVSHGLVAEFPMDCPADVKSLLMTHMGVVHRMVTEVSGWSGDTISVASKEIGIARCPRRHCCLRPRVLLAYGLLHECQTPSRSQTNRWMEQFVLSLRE